MAAQKKLEELESGTKKRQLEVWCVREKECEEERKRGSKRERESVCLCVSDIRCDISWVRGIFTRGLFAILVCVCLCGCVTVWLCVSVRVWLLF